MRKSNGIPYNEWIIIASAYCRARYNRADITYDFSRSFRYGYESDETPGQASDWIVVTAHLIVKDPKMSVDHNNKQINADEYLTRQNGATWSEWKIEAIVQCIKLWDNPSLVEKHQYPFVTKYENGSSPSAAALTIGTKCKLPGNIDWTM